MPPQSANDFLAFVNASPTPYHAVASAATLLRKAGFNKIKERDCWATTVRPGGKYYMTRNGSSIVAFAVGQDWTPGGPIAMVGAHTDSPCLRVKPVSRKTSTSTGFLQVGVECYGGGIWHSWFDRDLSVAGRLMVRDAATGGFVPKLVKVEKPILRIPHLAIHLHRQANFEPNKETELFPIAGLAAAELNKVGGQGREEKKAEVVEREKSAERLERAEDDDFEPLIPLTERHHPSFINLVAETAGVPPGDIVDFELVLYDTQRAVLGGLNDEFIYSARLDNLDMTYCAVRGLIESVSGDDSGLEQDSTIRLAAAFDHEEIGSLSAQGADSNLLPAVIRRLSVLPTSHKFQERGTEAKSTAFERTLSTSLLLSADMAHSIHPNYESKYEPRHGPSMNAGPVIKVNANQRYATNSPGIVLTQEFARRAQVPLQLFVVRNDSSCGSTIGPMLSAQMGLRTLDLGNAQLAMHSIREVAGSWDVEYAIKLFTAFWRGYGALEGKVLVDE